MSAPHVHQPAWDTLPVLCSRLFPDLKPYVEGDSQAALAPGQGPAPDAAQQYAELHLEDIIEQPAGSDATAGPPPSAGSIPQAPPQDPRKAQMQPKAEQGPYQPSVSAQGSQPGIATVQAPPQDPRLAARESQHPQHAAQDPRKLLNSAGHQPGQGFPSMGTAAAADSAQPSVKAAAPAGSAHLAPGNPDMGDDEEFLLYGSGAEANTDGKHLPARQPQRHVWEDHRQAEHAALGAPAEQLLYDNPLLLQEDPDLAKVAVSAELGSAEAGHLDSIPGLDDMQSSAGVAAQHHSSLPAEGGHSPDSALEYGQPAANGASNKPTGMMDSRSVHKNEPFSAGPPQDVLHISHSGRLNLGTSSVEQNAGTAGLPRPLNVQPHGTLGALQALQPGAPKPITLKPPPASREGSVRFKAHTRKYKR